MDLNRIFKKRKPSEYTVYSAVVLVGIILDQLTKWLAVKHLMSVSTVPLIEDVLHLTYLENRGAAFGSLQNMPWVFNSVSIIAIIAMTLYLYLGHAASALQGISVAMILSGGIGNMIDRIALGYVVDFIDFRLIDFAIFNGADSFVCVGAGLLILSLVLDLKKEIRLEREKKNTSTESEGEDQ